MQSDDRAFSEMLYARGADRKARILALGQMLYDEAASLPIGFRASYQACSTAWTGLAEYRGDGLIFTPEILAQQLLSLSP